MLSARPPSAVARKRYRANAANDLQACLAPFVTSVAWLRAAPPVETRKARQHRILGDAKLWRSLLKLASNLSFTKHQLEVSLLAICDISDWGSTVACRKTWAANHATTIQSSCKVIRAATSKEPPSTWCKTILSDVGPVEAFTREAMSGGGVAASSSDAAPAGEVSTAPAAEESQDDEVPPEADRPATAAPELPGGVVPEVPAEPLAETGLGDHDEYLYGWHNEIGKAWRSTIQANGRPGPRIFADGLAHHKPYRPDNLLLATWGQDKFQVPDMPMHVYCSRYAHAWVQFSEDVQEPADVSAPGPLLAGLSEAPPAKTAPLPPTPKAGAKSVAIPTTIASATTPAGEQIVCGLKKQSGRQDIWQIKIDGAAVLQAPSSNPEARSCMCEIVQRLASGEVEPKR